MNILIATDGSPSAIEAERLVADLVGPSSRHPLHILVVAHPSANAVVGAVESAAQTTLDEVEGEAVDQAKSILRRASSALNLDGLEVASEVRVGEPGEIILQFADEIGAGLIVMGSRGASAIGELLVGSVSQHVLHHARCPVLIAHDARLRAERQG